MQERKAAPGSTIELGRRWEHRARRIVFDISEWVGEYGAGSVRLLHQRPDDAAPYPVSVTRANPDGTPHPDGTLVLWDVTNVDTAQGGGDGRYGKAELRYYAGAEGAEEFLVKSDVYKTVTLDALGASLANAPEGEEDWLAALLGSVNNMEGSVSAAQVAAANADDAANTARAAAIAARAAQSEAEAARDAGAPGELADAVLCLGAGI